MPAKIKTPIPVFDSFDHIKKQTFTAHKNYTKADHPKADFKYAKAFILSYQGSKATLNMYRHEVERYLQWCWLIQKQSVKTIRRKDFEAFLEFCRNPPKEWIGKQQVPRFIETEGLRQPNEQWRPFITPKGKRKYQLSQAGWKSIFAVLSSFYQYLIEDDYTEINPVAQIRQKSKYIRKQQSKQPIRRLSELQWDYVIETAEIMADENTTHERTLFIMTCLYAMYLRISELAASERWTPEMNDFYQDDDGNWWFKTVGKGNKERDICVSNNMLKALKRYRKSLNLSPLPSRKDATPLLQKNHGTGPIASTRHIRRIVQECFDNAMVRMREDNLNEEAEQLESATVHWLRHTGISDDVKHRPREHVRDDAGHSSSAITDKYIDIERRSRHQSAKKKLVRPLEE